MRLDMIRPLIPAPDTPQHIAYRIPDNDFNWRQVAPPVRVVGLRLEHSTIRRFERTFRELPRPRKYALAVCDRRCAAFAARSQFHGEYRHASQPRARLLPVADCMQFTNELDN